MKAMIIQGSSNPNGNTQNIAQMLAESLHGDVLNLTTINVKPFDYTFENSSDDFNKTIHDILDNYDTLIFATPVYWYTMSGIMKNFIDRFTDGLLNDKALGRKFEGKQMAAIACGSSKDEIEGYFIPFQKTASYLKMNYLGSSHLWINADLGTTLEQQAQHRFDSFITLFK
jgi:multimeric flavodoxin WrbA